MTSITFYGGVDEIGGNKILVEDRDTKIFFDFGMSFGRRAMFFEEFLNPRSAAGLKDFLKMGMIPDVKGVYREDLIKTIGRKKEKREIDAVFLSHAHADHANYISFLRNDIPVYCGETCLLLLEAVHESTQRNIENEVIDFKPRPIMDYRKPPIERTFKTFRTGDKVRIGGVEVIPVHVDHSVPGAYGFVIHTTEGVIVYTGDFRLHGTHAEMTEDFVQAAIESDPLAMITEGTRIDVANDDRSEAKVKEECSKIVSESKKFVVADFNFKDVDRLRTFYNIAKENDRTFVITLKDACFLSHLAKDKKLGLPNLKDDSIAVYQPRRRSGTYNENDYRPWERSYLKGNVVRAEDVNKNQDKFIAALTFYSMNELIDIDPKPESIYIHSLSEPFNEETELDFKRLKNWVKHFRMRFFQSHCSGHASGNDIKEVVKRIGAKQLFPIHTEKPKLFKNLNKNVRFVENNKTYKI